MKHVLLLSVLLLGVAWAVAQDSTTRTQSQESSQTSSQNTAGSKASVTGCLSGSDGKYTLTDKQGTTYNLEGDSSTLAEHVGHEIKVTGTTSAGSAASGASSGMGNSQTIEVTAVKHISKTCQSGGGMSK